MKLLILDADGVFMDELPYWKTALAVALLRSDLVVDGSDRWEALAVAFFTRRGVQRITKGRACNSNWNLAAVMSVALQDPATRAKAAAALQAGDDDGMAGIVAERMDSLWHEPAADEPRVSGFGIDRHGPFFRSVVADFQEVFNGRRDMGWDYDRHALTAPAETTRAALRRLTELGLRLAVCTSRNGDETVEPMAQLDVLRYFDRQRVITHDEVDRARHETGERALGKPHWFPIACAVYGYDRALEARRSAQLTWPEPCERIVYTGDTPADFNAAVACRRVGLDIEYVHIDSGLCSDASNRAIHEHEITLLMASNLGEVARFFAENTP